MDLVWIEIRRDSCTIGIGFTIDDLPFGVWWAMGMKFTVSMRFGGQMVGEGHLDVLWTSGERLIIMI